MGNEALLIDSNSFKYTYPQHVDIVLTTWGSDVYWAIAATMMASTIAFVGLATKKPRSERIFHYITAAITLTASIAYFSLASNLGWAAIDVEFPRSDSGGRGFVAGTYREIFYVRYIDWFVTTPLLVRILPLLVELTSLTFEQLLDLLLTAGLPWPTIGFTLFLDIVMIVTGLVGALVRTSYKWGFYAFGCAALFGIAWNIVIVGLPHAKRLGADVHKTYLICGVWTMAIWMLYPVSWGLCEGGNVIDPNREAIFYGVLDLLAKPGFGALLIWGHRNLDPGRLGLNIHDYNQDFRKESKHVVGGNTDAVATSAELNNGTSGTHRNVDSETV